MCISLLIVAVTALFSIIQFFVTSGTESQNVVSTQNCSVTLVIDAGHGGEDGGATGASGVLEKDINLMISKQLYSFLSLTDIDCITTRDDDVMLYKDGQSGKKKYYDVRNRVEIAKSYDNPVFISIHQNKFPIEKYNGLQVYYSKHHKDSRLLALTVQDKTKEFLQPDNNRKIKQSGKSIYVLNNLSCPAILVECGFLSNSQEEKMLCDEEYRKKLSFVLFSAMLEYLTESGNLVSV